MPTYATYPTSSSSYVVVATADASAHTKGAYTEIVDSTPFDSSRVWLSVITAQTNRYHLVDLATGAAASETDIVNDLHYAPGTDGSGSWVGGCQWTPFDVDIPSGTRLSIRSQSSTGGSTIGLAIIVEDRARAGLTNPVTYGTVAAASRGTQVDPGATADTKGAWVELSASTSDSINALAIMFGNGTAGDAMAANQSWKVDIGTGAAASETVIIPDIVVRTTSIIDCPLPHIVRFPVSIPATTRLAVRCQCSVNTAVDRVLSVTLVGMQEPASSGGAGGSYVFFG
jgi:hypothetical protein